MKQAFIAPILFLFVLFLTACRPAQEVILPVHTPNAQSTGTASPTSPPDLTPQIARPPFTPTGTPTPGPTLSPKGPYLVMDTNLGAGPLLILDQDAGYKTLPLPGEGYTQQLRKALAPGGKWLAYQSAAPGMIDSSLTLALLSLDDSSTRVITQLISKDEPPEQDPASGKSDRNDRVDTKINLTHSAGTLAWSPDGQSLAFSAQIDGPSTDVYLYNLETGQISRLVDDPLNVDWIEWSPQGDTILYTNASMGLEDRQQVLYAIPVSGETIKNPVEIERGAAWIGKGWLSPIHYITAHQSHDGSFADLRVYNLETGLQASL